MSVTPPDEAPITGAYCALGDLRKGDIPLPTYMGNGTSYISAASDEIDAALGHLYKTPITFDDPPGSGTVPLTARPAALMLKKINWLIASGRLILDLAAAGENDNQHAYGMGMLKEGLGLLKQIVDGEITLTGADIVDPPEGQQPTTGPTIHNEDPASLVQGFYEQRSPANVYPIRYPGQVQPYGIPGVLRG